MFGSKFHSLDDLSKQGINTPLSLGISASLQKKFFEINGLTEVIKITLTNGESPYLFIIDHLKKNKVKFPDELTGIYNEVKNSFSEESDIALARSSANIEDSPTISFAGMFDSIPFELSSESSFKKAILGVWLSAIKQPVIDYLVTTCNTHLLTSLIKIMNVMLQPGLNAECAGVLFSKYTNTDDLSRSYATYGLGELINTCNIHQCELFEDKHLNQFGVQEIVHTRQALIFSSLKLNTSQVIPTIFGDCLAVSRYRPHMYMIRLPKAVVFGPAANKIVREKLFSTFNKILELRNGQRDFEIEWLFAKEKIYIVQIRPITAFESTGFKTKDMLPIVGGDLNGRIERWTDHSKNYNGKLIVVNDLSYDLIAILKNCSGILTLAGTPHSHAAIICRELGVPVYKISKDQYNNFSRGGYFMEHNELRSTHV